MNTYNIVFNDTDNSNDMGFAMTLDAAKSWVDQYNGTDHSYFADYKGGIV